jgi:hypothetical protein
MLGDQHLEVLLPSVLGLLHPAAVDSDGIKLAVRASLKATVATTGATYENSCTFFYRLEDLRIAESRDAFDTAFAADQVGRRATRGHPEWTPTASLDVGRRGSYSAYKTACVHAGRAITLKPIRADETDRMGVGPEECPCSTNFASMTLSCPGSQRS